VHLIEGLLANKSDIQPSTVHADTQGQSAPVFALATLFGFDLMPRIRNFRDLIFFRASEHLACPHIDELFGERGRNVIDWKLIERHWQDLMQVAISISEGRLSSATLMRRLRSNSRKNRIYKVFREVGHSVRTVALLRYLADPELRVRITAATNKVESYNRPARGDVAVPARPHQPVRRLRHRRPQPPAQAFNPVLKEVDFTARPLAA
jgi:TnpA family transposase